MIHMIYIEYFNDNLSQGSDHILFSQLLALSPKVPCNEFLKSISLGSIILYYDILSAERFSGLLRCLQNLEIFKLLKYF